MPGKHNDGWFAISWLALPTAATYVSFKCLLFDAIVSPLLAKPPRIVLTVASATSSFRRSSSTLDLSSLSLFLFPATWFCCPFLGMNSLRLPYHMNLLICHISCRKFMVKWPQSLWKVHNLVLCLVRGSEAIFPGHFTSPILYKCSTT